MNEHFTNFLNICTSLYSKGADLPSQIPLVIISTDLPTTDKEQLKSDFREFYSCHVSLFRSISLTLSMFNQAVDRTNFNIINAYRHPAPVLDNNKHFSDKALKKSALSSEIENIKFLSLYNSSQALIKRLAFELSSKLYRDTDSMHYIYIEDGQSALLTKADASERLTGLVQAYIIKTSPEFSQSLERKAPAIIAEVMHGLNRTSFFTSQFMRNYEECSHINPDQLVTRFSDCISWDKKACSPSDMNHFFKYLVLSFYVLSQWNSYRDTTDKPDIFPVFENERGGTGKSTIVQDIHGIFYPPRMLARVSEHLPTTDKELIELVTPCDPDTGEHLKASVFIDEFMFSRPHYAHIKDVLSKDTLTATLKYERAATSVQNNRFYFFASNEVNQIPQDERRFFIISNFEYSKDRNVCRPSLRFLAVDIIAKFEQLSTKEQAQYFNQVLRNMRDIAIKANQYHNRLTGLAEEYRDVLDTFCQCGNGYIRPDELKSNPAFRDLAQLKHKDLIKVMNLCGYEYSKKQISLSRFYAFRPTEQHNGDLEA